MPETVTAQAAAAELLKRRAARRNLIPFTEYTFPRYETAKHHRIIADQLERVFRGEIDRLMLLVPPRHGKSELASKRFPAFYLGHYPHHQFISVSATADLAQDFGRDVRNIIDSQEYGVLFDTRLAPDSQAKGKWHTSKGGIYYSVGIDGSVLGRGGHVILIDDPFSSMTDAMSETVRKNVWDFYTGTTYNRLEKDGKIVVINHRMHEGDLSGRLLAQQAAGGDQWEVVELPAVAEENDRAERQPGEALWPEKYSIAALDRIKRNTPARFWSGLYQQKPAPDEGTYWKSDWFIPYTAISPTSWTDGTGQSCDLGSMRLYGASDYAVTTDAGDYTVHGVVGIDPHDQPWLLDLWRGQTASDIWADKFCDLVLKWHPLAWAEEQGQIKSGVGPFLNKRQLERRAYVARETFPTRGGDKGIRAQSMRARAAQLGLRVPTYAPWYPAFLHELLTFPGKHDDQHDMLGLIGQLVDIMTAGQVPKTATNVVNIGYRRIQREVEGFKTY